MKNGNHNGNGASEASTTLSEKSDKELMKDICNKYAAPERARKSLDVLYSRHRSMLLTIASRLLGYADADDALQDVFVQLWKRPEIYDPEKGQVLGWLITLTRRRAIDRQRKSTAYLRGKKEYEQDINDGPVSNHCSVTKKVENNELASHCDTLLKQLPEPQEQAVRLAFLLGMSQREIAAKTLIPLGTIKTRIELGLKKLRRHNLG